MGGIKLIRKRGGGGGHSTEKITTRLTRSRAVEQKSVVDSSVQSERTSTADLDKETQVKDVNSGLNSVGEHSTASGEVNSSDTFEKSDRQSEDQLEGEPTSSENNQVNCEEKTEVENENLNEFVVSMNITNESEINKNVDEHVVVKDNVNEPEATKESAGDPEATEDNAGEPEATGNNVDEPETIEDNADEPDTTEDSADEPDTTEDNADEPKDTEEKIDVSEAIEEFVGESEAIDISVEPELTEDNADEPHTTEDHMDELEATDDNVDELEAMKGNVEEPDTNEENVDMPEETENITDEPEATESNADELEVTVDYTDEYEATEDSVDELEVTNDSAEELLTSENNVNKPGAGLENVDKSVASKESENGEDNFGDCEERNDIDSSNIDAPKENKDIAGVPDTQNQNPDVVEDEEVLQVIGELEKDLDAFFEFTDGSETNDIDSRGIKNDNCKRMKSEDSRTMKKDDDIVIDSQKAGHSVGNKEIGGLTNLGLYSRVLIVGDSRMQSLKDCWLRYPFIKPQFLIDPHLKFENLKDFILSQTELPHLENGTLLICCLGIHDIVNLEDFGNCSKIENHEPMKVMTLTEKAAENIIRTVTFNVTAAHKELTKILGYNSSICFAPVFPCDPPGHFDEQEKNHTPRGHTTIGVLREFLQMMKSKVKIVCSRINKHMIRYCRYRHLWQAFDLESSRISLKDGIDYATSTSQKLVFRINRFLQEMFYGVNIMATYVKFSRPHEVILVGDSRLTELEKMWCGDKPQFYCEPNLAFHNFEKFINENLVELKDKMIIVCLGLNDLIQFVDDERCMLKGHEPHQMVLSICENYSNTREYMRKILQNFRNSFTLLSKVNPSLLMFFATIYPFNMDQYMSSQVKFHKEKTGHDITPPQKNAESEAKLNELLSKMNMLIRKMTSEQGLPCWDMYEVVCKETQTSTINSDVLKDGIYPSEKIAEALIHSFFLFSNQNLCQQFDEDVKAYKFLQISSPTKKSDIEYVKQERALFFPSYVKEKMLYPSHVKEIITSGGKEENLGIEKKNIATENVSSGISDFEEESKISQEKEKRPEQQRTKESKHQSSTTPSTAKTLQHPNLDSKTLTTESRKRSSSPTHRRQPFEDGRPSVFARLGYKKFPAERGPASVEGRDRTKSQNKSKSPERSQNKCKSSERSQNKSKSPERSRSPYHSKRSIGHSQRSRSPHYRERSRSPYHPERSRPHNYPEKSRSPHHPERSRSPHHPERSRSPHHPERSRTHHYPERSRPPHHVERSRYHQSYDRSSSSKQETLNRFRDSVREIRRKCRNEKVSIREALCDLLDAHVCECELYLGKPDAHPDYTKEYKLFFEKKKDFILNLGGDPLAYNYVPDWRLFWPIRMLALFQESWEVKKNKCLSMISLKKRRLPSSSSSAKKRKPPSSASFTRKRRSPSSSSSSRESTPEKRRKHSRAPESQYVKHPPERQYVKHSPERQYVKHSPERPYVKHSPEKQYVKHSPERQYVKHSPEHKKAVFEMASMSRTQRTTEKTLEGEIMPKPMESSRSSTVKAGEVLGILAYMKERLGVYEVPVRMLFEKTQRMEKSGLDPNIILEDKDTMTMFSLLSGKLLSLVEEGSGSAIQKAIILEAHTLLQDLINQNKIKKEANPLDIGQIARLTMGKSISETIMTIKNFLLYNGSTDVSEKVLENIYMSVRDEQLKLTGSRSSSQLQRPAGVSSEYDRTRERGISPESTRPGQRFTSLIPPQEESSKNFFTGQRSFPSKDVGLSKSYTVKASSSKFDIPVEMDEEFFTGKKFLKPNEDYERASVTQKPTYIPRKHVVPPPAPILSGMSGMHASQNKPSTSSVAKGVLESVDYDLLRNCLASLKNIPK